MRRISNTVRRVVVFVLLAVGFNLVLALLAREAPSAMVAVAVVGAVLLVLAVVRTFRSDRRLQGLALMLLAAVGGWVIALGVDAVIGRDSESVAGEDGIAAPRIAPGSLPFVATVGTAPIPFAELYPDAVAPQQDPEPLADGPGTVVGAAVTAEGANAVISITPADVGFLPAELVVFRHANPGRPISFAAADGWVPVGVSAAEANITWDGALLRVTIVGGAGDAYAVVDPAGNRYPENGYARDDGSELPVASTVVAVEIGFPSLPAEHRRFVASLLGRQLTTGEFRLQGEGSGVEVVFTADRPAFSQTAADGATGIFETGGGRYRCDGSGCEPADDLTLPVDAALAIVADASSLVLTVEPAGAGDGSTCVVIVAAPSGVSTGRSCWDENGRPTLIEPSDGAERFVLLSSGAVADAARLEPPEGVDR